MLHTMIRTGLLASLLAVALVLGVAAEGATKSLIRGTPANDRLVGTAKDDRIYGLAGNDEIRGLGGFDILVGGSGGDTLWAGSGKDYLSGDEGDDTLFVTYGRALADFASCGAGDDLVVVDGVPESARAGVRRRLNDAPSYCETIRFAGG
jgi:Ca2+-binding RTX toxin-like protein